MRTEALRRNMATKSAIIVGMSLFWLSACRSTSEAQSSPEQPKQQVKDSKEETDVEKQKYERDKKIIASAYQAIGMLDIFDRQMLKRLDEKRTRFNRWEIAKTKTLAPVGTMLY